MTLDEIRGSDKDFLVPADVAEVIGCQAYSINLQAKTDLAKLGFPAALIGTRVRIPRKGFLKWMGEEVDE